MYLDHVFLDTGALMAAQDGEQFIIRNEEEPREGISLGVQVVIEALLAALQPRVDHLQVLQTVLRVAGVIHQRVLGCLCHNLSVAGDGRKVELNKLYQLEATESRRSTQLESPGL